MNRFLQKHIGGLSMKIGYACLTVGVQDVRQRTCLMKNATSDALMSMIKANIEVLDRVIDYNIKNEIKLFRISSDIIPFGSHAINTLEWWEIFSDELKQIGRKAKSNGIRLSMHPGQYTVLNSPDDMVVSRAIDDLKYHNRFLDAICVDEENKIILHIGGIYGDKQASIKRFVQQYRNLEKGIKNRLVIENDDSRYTISDVLSIGINEKIPVVFDNLHHRVNPPDKARSEAEWILDAGKTWQKKDGIQKIHYSQQHLLKRTGSHSETIDIDEFLEFYLCLSMQDQDIDIMLEVKDKNLSAVKCINAVSESKIQRLEKEWALYKYLVLEHSPQIYNEIRQLLKDKKAYPVKDFYRLIDKAISTPIMAGNAINAGQHVWGYVKDFVDQKTKLSFEKSLERIKQGHSTATMKRLLWKLAKFYKQNYLLESLYFMEIF